VLEKKGPVGATFFVECWQIIKVESYAKAALSPFLVYSLLKKQKVVAIFLELQTKRRSTFSFLITHFLFLIS
jgi:hypothetical protein